MVSTIILDIGLMAMLVVVAFAIVRLRSLFAIVMLQGVYSLVSAAWFVSLDAVDVAFTEAAVGAGVSTVLMLAAMLLVDRQSNPVPVSKQVAPLLIVIVAGIAMFYAIPDMPAYGDGNSPANSYVGADYLERTAEETHVPNVVTAVLASYRGYDTFGETVVIFAAGLGVLMLLGLNGNAGNWRATPNGQRISAPSAPAALRHRPPVKGPPQPAPSVVTAAGTKRREIVAEPEIDPAPLAAPSEVTPQTYTAPQPKPVAKRTPAKKTPAKKSTVKKTTSKKALAKKPVAKKAAVKKSVTKRAPAKKSSPKKPAAKKTTAKKPTAKKAPAKKTTPKKATAKKPAAKRGPGRPRKTPKDGGKS